MPRRSPLTSVMPALSIATSVPVPIAMPTSAAASAGASLMPSPAIATTAPPAAAVLRRASCLSSGATPASTSIDAELLRDGFGGALVVAGEHDDLQAERVQCADGLGRRGLDRVGDGEQAGGLSVDGDEDDGLALRSAAARRRSASASMPVTPCRCKKCALADEHAASVHVVPATPPPVVDWKFCHCAQVSGCALCAPRRWRRPADVRSLARARRRGAAVRLASMPRSGSHLDASCGLPSVSVPVLSTTSVVTFSRRSRPRRSSRARPPARRVRRRP